MIFDYTTLPTCNSDQNANGDRPQADLLEIVMGLRAMVKGDLPAAKPACPAAVTETLPRHNREDALRQETANHTKRLKSKRMAHWAEQLAEAELSWFNDYEVRRKTEGHTEDTFLQVDEQLDADTSWMDALAYDELVSWLRLEAKLTDKEVEALELRAAGLPQKGGKVETLRRAQKKARAAM